MTKDDIILIADASGIAYYGMGKDRDKFLHYLEAFANLVAASEREACAKVCEEIMQEHDPFDRQAGVARRCLDDIRARSQA